MREVLSSLPLIGAIRSPMFAALAQVCADNGLPEAGFAAVAEGLELAERTAERHSEAELHRIKGDLILMQDRPDMALAELCFRIAIDLARGQSARLYELRATTSLARLLKRRGKPDEARAMLSEIYNWFTEGFEFADLKDAKALLDEFAARPEK